MTRIAEAYIIALAVLAALMTTAVISACLGQVVYAVLLT